MLGTLIALHRLWVFYSHSLLGSGHYKSTTYVIACRGYYLQSGFFCFIPFLPIVSITVSMSGFTGLQCVGAWAVILLQIVMVSPATHLEKNHKSQSRTNKSQLKKKQTNKQGVLNWKYLSLLVNRQLNKHAFTIVFFTAVNHNYDHKQRTLKHKNTQNGSKSTNHKSQTLTFWTR